jgi:hypothetical protein
MGITQNMIYFGMVISILDIGIQGHPTVGKNNFVPWAKPYLSK